MPPLGCFLLSQAAGVDSRSQSRFPGAQGSPCPNILPLPWQEAYLSDWKRTQGPEGTCSQIREGAECGDRSLYPHPHSHPCLSFDTQSLNHPLPPAVDLFWGLNKQKWRRAAGGGEPLGVLGRGGSERGSLGYPRGPCDTFLSASLVWEAS